MLGAFSSVSPYLKVDNKKVIIDNFVFKLHYRWTFIILIVATILNCSRQYIGEHIKCLSDTIPGNVINNFCFFTPTFTVVRHLNNSMLDSNGHPNPGIGPMESDHDPIRRHAYYQWVPFVLFGQAIFFYLPHIFWKNAEGGRLKALVYGLRMVGITNYIHNNSLKIGGLPSKDEVRTRIKDIRKTMVNRMRLNQSWGAHLIFSEILNLLNLLLQIYLTNRFLQGEFLTLGIKVLREKWDKNMDCLDIVFPKMTKCFFFKYGASGSLQKHDALCVMALNIINEKIYSILWFWYAFVLIATVTALLWRLITIMKYKSVKFTIRAFTWIKPGRINRNDLEPVVEKCNFSNWMFLLFLRSNLSEFLFKKVISHLGNEIGDVGGPYDETSKLYPKID